MFIKFTSIHKKIALAAFLGVLIGIAWLILLRMALAKNTAVHYHANFAVYVMGERLKFEGPTFYEEISACGENGRDNPKARVHMHNNVDYVVHVHDNAASWGHFFANLRYGLSDSSLTLDDKILIDGDGGNNLKFVLNGQAVSTVANRAIGSEDALLISYGPADQAQLDAQYQSIIKDAGDYNKQADPSACAGSKQLTIKERFKRAVEFNPEH